MSGQEIFLQPVGPGGQGYSEDGDHAFLVWSAMGTLKGVERQNLIRDVASLSCIARCEWYTDDRTGAHRLLLVRASGSWLDAAGESVRETIQRHLNIPTTLQVGTKSS